MTTYFLSEPHNFGQRVYRINSSNQVFKPRTVFWEWLLLTNSPFRQYIETELKKVCAFSGTPLSLPKINVKIDSMFSGHADFLSLTPISRLDEEQSVKIGFTIALFAWMGMSDLHKENIILGLDQNNQFIFTSLDIETIYDDLATLGHSGLVPDQWVPKKVSGIFSLLDLFENSQVEDSCFAAIIYGYLNGLQVLECNRINIEKLLFETIGTSQIPIRVVLRKTKSYVDYLNGIAPPLAFLVPPFDEELEQLSRKDIPYFFRFPAEPDVIYFFKSPDEFTFCRFRSDFYTIPLLKRRIINISCTPRQNFTLLLKTGSLQLLKSFILAKNTSDGQSVFNHTRVDWKTNKIYLNFNNTIKISTSIH